MTKWLLNMGEPGDPRHKLLSPGDRISGTNYMIQAQNVPHLSMADVIVEAVRDFDIQPGTTFLISDDQTGETRTVSVGYGPCTMGVGCDEYGSCYASYHGEPDRCEQTRLITDGPA